jgi:hypothetical protein
MIVNVPHADFFGFFFRAFTVDCRASFIDWDDIVDILVRLGLRCGAARGGSENVVDFGAPAPASMSALPPVLVVTFAAGTAPTSTSGGAELHDVASIPTSVAELQDVDSMSGFLLPKTLWLISSTISIRRQPSEQSREQVECVESVCSRVAKLGEAVVVLPSFSMSSNRNTI